jgi:hypothetical protein
VRIRLALLLSLSLTSPALAADAVPDDVRVQYAKLVPRAEAALQRDGVGAAIEIYEDALVGFAAGYGRVHLRLAQLYQKLGRTAEVAAHFRDCMSDDRVDALDREIICKQGYDAATTKFDYVGLPNGGRLVVLKPELFAGKVDSGDRLPNGPIQLTVEAPGRRARKAELTLPQARPWQVMVGLLRRQGPIVPDGFVSQGGSDDFASGTAPEPAGDGTGWPIWATGGTGAAVLATGLTLGFMSRGALDDTRSDQRSGACGTFCADELADAQNLATTADVLWMSGAIITTGAVVWWLLDD